jgi:hypothetical protein
MATTRFSAIAAFVIILLCSFATQAEEPLPGEEEIIVASDQGSDTHAAVTFTFPSSHAKPKGSAWKHMHASGFTGGYEKGCGLIGLTPTQCAKYTKMHSDAVCQIVDVPNGIVLDRLTFSRNGTHHVQKNVLVDLQNPITRKTEVCDLGNGLYAMRFHGCDNHGLVRLHIHVPKPVAVIERRVELPPVVVYTPTENPRPQRRALHVICDQEPCGPQTQALGGRNVQPY